MVFFFRCLSFGNVNHVPEDEASAQANTSDDFYTAYSNFNGTQSGSAPSSQNIRGPSVPSLDLGPGTLRSFTYAELKTATRNFDLSSKIGEGGFGNVHMCVVKSLEYPFKEISMAVKRGKKGSQGHKQFVTEVNVLGKVEHPNLVKLVGYCAEDIGNENHRLLVYEYMPNGSLDDRLAQSGATLSWGRRLKIARDAATGLAYLHEGMPYKIIFRDFKPSNILLDSKWNAKLSDFGFARPVTEVDRTHVSTAVVGTKGYAAPEYVQTGRLTLKSDVWSFGIFLQELITGQRPRAQNNSRNNSELLKWVKCCYLGAGKSKLIVDSRLVGTYSQKSMEKLASTAKKCLAKEPKSRPKMSEVLKMVNEAIALEDGQLQNAGHT